VLRLDSVARQRNFVAAREEGLAWPLEIGPRKRNFVAAREEGLACC
jgi:hypothetical protein